MNITDYLPRIVLPDRVILPEEIESITLDAVSIINASFNDFDTFELERARYDRATGLSDKNGKMIYENDILQWGDSIERVTFEFGCWLIRTVKSGLACDFYGKEKDCEVTGMVPYSPEAKNDNT